MSTTVPGGASVTSIYYVFRDSPERRHALATPRGAVERYRLYGLDELRERGHEVRYNLERAAPPAWARTAGGLVKRGIEHVGGYSGDFATALASLRPANHADVVFSTVDTVGIPLMLLNRAGMVRRPLVYAAIGLPERLARLRSERMRGLYASALASSAAVIAYSEYEADQLRRFMAGCGESTRVEFVPFGVDARAFAPSLVQPVVDVVSVGADPHRDARLLLRVAAAMPNRTFRMVTTSERARELQTVPPNVEVEVDIPFEGMRRRLEEARVVALPVLDNSYSGATTVLLQAMALGKAVVVTRTRAIAVGYELSDGDNCRLVEPGDAVAFQRALSDVLRDEWRARALGGRARHTVEAGFTWERYVDRLEGILCGASSAPQDARSRGA